MKCLTKIGILFICLVLLNVSLFAAPNLDEIYSTKLRYLGEQAENTTIAHAIGDFNGDGIKDLFVLDCQSRGDGSLYHEIFFTYKNGKLIRLVDRPANVNMLTGSIYVVSTKSGRSLVKYVDDIPYDEGHVMSVAYYDCADYPKYVKSVNSITGTKYTKFGKSIDDYNDISEKEYTNALSGYAQGSLLATRIKDAPNLYEYEHLKGIDGEN